MKFKEALVHGTLIKRYKRFLSDILLDTGETVVAHCTNSGSMKSCIEEGAEVYISKASDPNRKTKFTWEMIRINENWVGINTMVPNIIVYEALKASEIDGLPTFDIIKREMVFDDSRFDIYAENSEIKCFIEVKNVTMKEGKHALFPDAVTTRGKKHLETLIKAKKEGYRAVMIYIIQRQDVEIFAPAWGIDPGYAKSLVRANKAGVEIIPLITIVNPMEIRISHTIPYDLTYKQEF